MTTRYPRTDRGKRLLESVVASLNAQYEKAKREISVSLLEASEFARPRAYVPSGILPLDLIVSPNGEGFPVGGIVEIFGPQHSGKSAILEHILSGAQRKGYYTFLEPMEFSIDFRRMRSVGISPSRLVVGEAETIEDVYDHIRGIISAVRKKDSTTPIVIGVDTLAAIPTRSELDHKEGLAASDMGKAALQLSKLFRRLVGLLFKNRVCLVCVNQTRMKLGQVWGSKETTPGGRAILYYAWIRCRVGITKMVKDSEGREVGQLCTVRVVKNKIAPPFRTCVLPLYWDRGIDADEAIWIHAVENGLFERKGTSYRYGNLKITKNSFLQKVLPRCRGDIQEALRSLEI